MNIHESENVKQRARTTNGKIALLICLKLKMVEYVLKCCNSTNDDFMSVVMMSFSNSFLNYDAINSVIITERNFCVEISMLFFHNSHTPHPSIQFL